MAVEVLALLLVLSASDGTGEVRHRSEPVLTEQQKARAPKPEAVIPPKTASSPKDAKGASKNAPTKVSKKASGESKKTKKDPGSKKAVNPKKPAQKQPKPAMGSPDDAEIIEHLEFLMLLDLLQDFELFEEDPS